MSSLDEVIRAFLKGARRCPTAIKTRALNKQSRLVTRKNTALLLGCMLEPKWIQVNAEGDATVQTMPNHHLCPVQRCIWSVLLEPYGLPQFVKLFFIAVSDPLLPVRMPFILFSSCCFSFSPDATGRRSSHLLLIPGFHRPIPCTSFHSSPFQDH